MNPYKKGYAFERAVVQHLQTKRYFVVRQGKSAFPDIIAVDREGKTMLIECKVGGKLRLYEKRQLRHWELVNKVHSYLCYPKWGAYSKKDDNIILERIE